MIRIVHAAAGALAMMIIAAFWSSTLVAELFLDQGTVIIVKQTIAFGLFLLVPCMAGTGGSGIVLSKSATKGLIGTKKKRMMVVGTNGLLLMIPMAVFLNYKAGHAQFDTVFYAVQVLELLVGPVQLTLLGLNFRDGLKFRRAILSVKH